MLLAVLNRFSSEQKMSHRKSLTINNINKTEHTHTQKPIIKWLSYFGCCLSSLIHYKFSANNLFKWTNFLRISSLSFRIKCKMRSHPKPPPWCTDVSMRPQKTKSKIMTHNALTIQGKIKWIRTPLWFARSHFKPHAFIMNIICIHINSFQWIFIDPVEYKWANL